MNEMNLDEALNGQDEEEEKYDRAYYKERFLDNVDSDEFLGGLDAMNELLDEHGPEVMKLIGKVGEDFLRPLVRAFRKETLEGCKEIIETKTDAIMAAHQKLVVDGPFDNDQFVKLFGSK